MRSKNKYERLVRRLLPKHKGKIIAIDPTTGRYLIGTDELSVAKKALGLFHGRLLDFYRIGAPALHKFRRKRQ